MPCLKFYSMAKVNKISGVITALQIGFRFLFKPNHKIGGKTQTLYEVFYLCILETSLESIFRLWFDIMMY